MFYVTLKYQFPFLTSSGQRQRAARERGLPRAQEGRKSGSMKGGSSSLWKTDEIKESRCWFMPWGAFECSFFIYFTLVIDVLMLILPEIFQIKGFYFFIIYFTLIEQLVWLVSLIQLYYIIYLLYFCLSLRCTERSNSSHEHLFLVGIWPQEIQERTMQEHSALI